jgi:hypothetical protein
MQSDNRTVTKIELATQQETKEQFNDQQKPESSGQRHHSPGVDGKSLEDELGTRLVIDGNPKRPGNGPHEPNCRYFFCAAIGNNS